MAHCTICQDVKNQQDSSTVCNSIGPIAQTNSFLKVLNHPVSKVLQLLFWPSCFRETEKEVKSACITMGLLRTCQFLPVPLLLRVFYCSCYFPKLWESFLFCLKNSWMDLFTNIFWNQIPLCSPRWPWTHDSLASDYQVLGWQKHVPPHTV